MSAPETIPVIDSIGSLAGGYDAWLCDIWGVLHNGERPFAEADHACRTFREHGGTVVLISNSPRPGSAVSRQLAQIGVSDDSYDAIVTSGDTTRHVLAKRSGDPLFHLGPDRDKPLLEGLDLRLVDVEDADFVLCSGLYDDVTETPEHYGELLSRFRARDLEMVCANPDIQVERGERLIYCAGALAQAYEQLGGRVIYTGKPHAPIYEKAIEQIGNVKGRDVAPERILCIGDNLKTDIAGAAEAGMDVVFVASALHVEGTHDETPLTEAALSLVFAGVAARPIAAQKRLLW